MSVEQEVIEVVVDQLGVDKSEVSLESRFVEDLNADSLDLTELVLELEGKFKCEISQEEAETLKSVRDVVDYINGKA